MNRRRPSHFQMMSPVSLRRRLALGGVALLAIVIASCDNSTSGLRASNAAAFAFKPSFEYAGAMRAVPVARVRVLLARPGSPNAPALDTTITYPVGQDSLVASFDVPILSLTGTESFDLNLAMMGPQGDTVFKGTAPVTLNVQKAGDPPPAPAPIPITYVGPGKDATTLRISPRSTAVNFGDTLTFSATATNSAGAVVAAPVTYRVLDTTRLAALDLTSGRIVGRPLRGLARVVASTLTGQADTATVEVKPIPASMKITSGNAQSGIANTNLANDLVVQVLAADSVGMPGAFVRFFVPSAGGQLADTVVTTDADGFARTRLRVGTTVGPVAITASMSNAGGAPFTGASVRNNPLSLNATITHAAPAKLLFTAQPTNATAGASIAPAIVVTVQDAFNNTATSFAGTVSLALTDSTARGASVTGTPSVAAVAGVATFSLARIEKANTRYTIRASSGQLTAATSAAFDVLPGAPAALAFRTQPTRVVAGTPFSPVVSVEARDAFGNFVPSFTGTVKFAPTVGVGTTQEGQSITQPPDSVLPRVAAVAGVASFPSTVLLEQAVRGVSMTATSGTLTPGVSDTFSVVHAAAHHLSFQSQPVNVTAGGNIAASGITVEIQDAFDNRVLTSSDSVFLTLPPNSGTLSGVTRLKAVEGRVRFTTVTATQAANPTLIAQSPSLASVSSAAFSVTPGAATAFQVIRAASTTSASGQPLATQPILQLVDAFGNVVSLANRTVTVTASGGATVSNGVVTTSSTGRATYATLTVTGTAGSRTLTYTTTNAGGATVSTTSNLNLTAGSADAAQSSVTVASTATAGTPVSATVTLRDASGNALTVGGQTVSARVTGANASRPVNTTDNGNGTFTVSYTPNIAGSDNLEVSLNTTAIGGGNAITVSAGAATAISIITQPPATAAAGATLAASSVRLVDPFGNPVRTIGVPVTASIGVGAGTLSGGLTTSTDVDGVATFTSLSIGGVTGSRNLRYDATGLTGAQSNAVNIGVGAPNAAQSTATVPAGVAGSPTTIAIQVRDAFGNARTTSSGTVTVSVSGANTVSPTAATDNANGTYTFIYTPTAAGTDNVAIVLGTTAIGGSPFASVVSAGSLHHFAVQNSGGGSIGTQTAGGTFGVRITAQDANNNTVTTFTGTVNVSGSTALASGSGTTATFVAGVLPSHPVSSTIAGPLQLNVVRTDGTEAGSSNSFTVVGGSLDHFDIQAPGGGSIGTQAAGVPFTIQILARDQFNNTASSFNGTVTLTSATADIVGAPVTTGSFTNGILATQSVTARSAGTARTLSVTDGSGHAGTSAGFTVTAGNADASQSLISVSTSTVPADGSTPITISVQLKDALGNLRTSDGGTVVLSTTRGTIGGLTNNHNGTWTAQVTSTDVGSATISGTLDGTAMTSTQSVSFTAMSANAAQSSATVPSTGTVGTQSNIQVIARDAFNHPVSGATVAVRVTGADSATAGSLTVTDVGGGTYTAAYTPTLTGTDLVTVTVNGSPVPGSPFTSTIAAGAAVASTSYANVPPTAMSGTSTTITITTRDANGNLRTTGSGPNAVAVTTTGMNVSGPTFATDNGDGTYSFSYTPIAAGTDNIAITLNGSPIASSPYSITVLAGNLHHFMIERTGGGSLSPQTSGTPFNLRITARDIHDNLVTTFTGTVNVSASGGATISSGAGPTAAFVNGELPAHSVTIGSIGSGSTQLTVVRTGGTESGTSETITVASATVDHFDITNSAGNAVGTVTAGDVVDLKIVARDVNGNVVSSFTGSVDLTSANANLAGAPVRVGPFTSGVYPFVNVMPRSAGSARVIQATEVDGPHVGSSNPFTVVPGGPNAIHSTATVPSGIAGTPTVVTLQLRDQYDNALGNSAGVIVTGFIGGVNAGRPVVVGDNSNGTFSLTYTPLSAGTDFIQVQVDVDGLGPTPSSGIGGAPFSSVVSAGAGSSLSIETQPSTPHTSGTQFAQQPVVRVRDGSGNVVNEPGVNVTVSILSQPGSLGSLTGTTTVVTDNSGMATFTDVGLAGEAGNYVLQFTAPGHTSASSQTVVLTAGVAANLEFIEAPPAVFTIGNGFEVKVKVKDVHGNGVSGRVVTAYQVSGTFSFDESSTLVATSDAGGIATFSNIKINGPGGPYYIAFSLGAESGVPDLVSDAINQQSPPSLSGIDIVSGNQQYVLQGQSTGPITVRVRDEGNVGVAGVAVRFLSYDGTPSTEVTTTNASGEASTTFASNGEGVTYMEACVGFHDEGETYWCDFTAPINTIVSPTGTTHTWKVGLFGEFPFVWNDPANWAQGSVPTPSSVVFFPDGQGPTLSGDVAITSWKALNDAQVVELAGHTLTVTGSFRDRAGFSNGKVVLEGGTLASPADFFGRFSSGADFDITGVYVMSEFSEVRNLTVKGNGRLILHEEVDVAADFATADNGTLVMQDGSPYLYVGNGNVTFAGGDETGLITTGAIDLYGDFTQVGGTSHSFTSSDDFVLYMDGNERGHLRMDDPTAVITRLQDFNNYGLEIQGNDGSIIANIGEMLVATEGGAGSEVTTNTSTGIVRIMKDLAVPDFSGHFWQVPVTYADGPDVYFNGVRTNSKMYIKSGHTRFNDVATTSDVIADGGLLEITGGAGSSAATFTTMNGGKLRQIWGTTFSIAGDVLFDGGSLSGDLNLLHSGVLEIGGNFSQGDNSAPDGFVADGNHITRFTGSSPEIYVNHPESSHFGTVEFANPSGNFRLDSDIELSGHLTAMGNLLSTGIPRNVTVAGNVEFQANATINRLSVAGNYTPGIGTVSINTMRFTGYDQYIYPVSGGYNNVEVAGRAYTNGGAVTINGALTLGSDLPGNGSLELLDRLQVNGNVIVGADASSPHGLLGLSGQTLKVGGSFETRQSGQLRMIGAESGIDSLIVTGDLKFKGGSTDGMLTKGAITYGGNFEQTGSITAFAPTGDHRVVWNGIGTPGSPKTISFAHPGADSSHFNRFQVRGTDEGCFAACTVKILSTVVVRDSLVLDGPDGGSIIDSPTSTNVLYVPGYVTTPLGGVNVRNLALGHAPPASASLVADTIQYRNLNPLDSLPQVYAGYSNTVVVVKGTINSGGYDQTLKGLIIAGNGSLNLGPHTLTITTNFETRDNGILIQGNNDPLIVHGNVVFGGGDETSNLTSAYIDVYGNFTQLSTTSPRSFVHSGSHYIRFVGSAPRTISFATPDTVASGVNGSLFNNFRINTTNATITMNGVVPANTFAFEGSNNTLTGTGLFWLGGQDAGGTLSIESGSANTLSVNRLRYAEDISGDVGGIAADTIIFGRTSLRTPQSGINYRSLRIVGTNTRAPLGGLDLANDLIISDNGVFDVLGRTVSVGGDLKTSGSGYVKMVTGSDQLIVTGNATFAGGSESSRLTIGTLSVGGNLTVAGSGTFVASGSHLTKLTGATSVLTADASNGNRFARFEFANSNGQASLATDIKIAGQLRASVPNLSTATVNGNGHTITAGGLSVNSGGSTGTLIVSNAPIVVLDTSVTMSSFNNVTFQNFATSATQLTVNSGSNRGAGSVSWTGLSFMPLTNGDTGKYLQWNQSDVSFSIGTSSFSPSSNPGSFFGRLLLNGGSLTVSGPWGP